MSAPKLFRYPNEAAGALVLLALLLFIGSVLQSGRLNDWFETGAKLKVILPEEGLFGLSRGGKVEILGTQAGVVEEVVIARDQKIHAIVEIQKEMKRFVRRDSRAIIRKQFGVAGAAYLEISRGRGEPLDWEHAVIKARAEQAPTESMGELLTELRTNVMPLLKKARQLVASMNEITGTIASGEGAIGRLVTNDRIALEMESLLSRMDTSTRQLPSLLGSLREAAGNFSDLSGELVEPSRGVPQLTRRAGELVASLQTVARDLNSTTAQLPQTVENVKRTTGDLPVLLIQTREALAEFTRLMQQLQSHWLLGGGERRETETGDRISPREIRP